MKLTEQLISIPPYISTTWDNVTSLHTEEDNLVIGLKNSPAVTIPRLDSSVIEQIFQLHAHYLETHPRQQKPSGQSIEQLFTLPLKINLRQQDTAKGDILGTMLQHDPTHSDLPPIPEDIADKLSPLTGMIREEDIMAMPPSEPNCNCMYCQIHRLLLKKFTHTQHPEIEVHHEEHVSDHELHFQEWEVKHVKDKIYTVTNKLEPHEQYTVYLGEPIGCTCGKSNCEHIIAVLRS